MARMNFDKLTLKRVAGGPRLRIADLIETKKQEERESLKTKLAALASERRIYRRRAVQWKDQQGRGCWPVSKGQEDRPEISQPRERRSRFGQGRGRKPLWFVAALKKGVKPEKLLIR